jgi:hypothetical protein
VAQGIRGAKTGLDRKHPGWREPALLEDLPESRAERYLRSLVLERCLDSNV